MLLLSCCDFLQSTSHSLSQEGCALAPGGLSWLLLTPSGPGDRKLRRQPCVPKEEINLFLKEREYSMWGATQMSLVQVGIDRASGRHGNVPSPGAAHLMLGSVVCLSVSFPP